MQWLKVESSNISSVGYDRGAQVLEVEFRGGTRYRYSGVPADKYDELMASPSKGSYLHRHIAHNAEYPCERVHAQPA